MSATNRGAIRSEQDLYRTPQWCCDILAERIEKIVTGFDQSVVLIDAGAGDGRIGKTVREKIHGHTSELLGVEIDPKQRGGYSFSGWVQESFASWIDDFEENDPCVIVSNPPFSQAESFVFSAVASIKRSGIGVAVFLLRMNWLSSKRRAAWLNANHPSRITVLAPRPSFRVTESIGKDGKKRKSTTDACEYAWVWWGAGELGAHVASDTNFEVAVGPEKPRKKRHAK